MDKENVTHTHVCAHTCTHAHTRAHICVHTCTHMHMHTDTHIHIGISFNHGKKEILPLTTTWMKLEDIMLSEMSDIEN